jgi:hypothetical protein
MVLHHTKIMHSEWNNQQTEMAAYRLRKYLQTI